MGSVPPPGGAGYPGQPGAYPGQPGAYPPAPGGYPGAQPYPGAGQAGYPNPGKFTLVIASAKPHTPIPSIAETQFPYPLNPIPLNPLSKYPNGVSGSGGMGMGSRYGHCVSAVFAFRGIRVRSTLIVCKL